MLVDNSIQGDSRVQKQARSMAERGWQVHLVGRDRHSKSVARFHMGEAVVTVLPYDTAMDRRRHQFRRAWMRSPLAYRPGPLSGYRTLQVRAGRSFLATDLARSQAGTGVTSKIWVMATRVRLFANRVEGRWVRARVRRTRALSVRRRELSGWTDRVSTRFWTTVGGASAWRKLDPSLSAFEATFASFVDDLRPDIIHANDFRMLGVGARAKTRAAAEGREVRLVWDAHEFLPGIRPWDTNPRWRTAQILHERQFVPYADAVVTVTEPLADLLIAEHGLDARPTVVMNAPVVDDRPSSDLVDIRSACGLDEDTPLLVYSGAVAPQRGVDTMIDALVALADVHAALVVSFPPNVTVRALVNRAEELGVRERLHLVPYVAVNDIVPFMSTATIGVMPAHKWINHEVSLATKFFEYAHARLPMVVSNLKAMAGAVETIGLGEVFTAEDTAGFVAAVRLVLADPERYRRAYEDADLMDSWTWQRQADVLHEVYTGVMADGTALDDGP